MEIESVKTGLNARTDQNHSGEKLSVLAVAQAARSAASSLAGSSHEQRNAALRAVEEQLRADEELILSANARDLNAAKESLDNQQLTQSMFSRLKLDTNKLDDLRTGINQLIEMPDPLGQVDLARELDHGLILYQKSCPIGVVGVIFESRPDAFAQIGALCLKSGNCAILKGGREAVHTNRVFLDCFGKGLRQAGFPETAIQLVEGREAVEQLLAADQFVDLIIPRGSNELVRHIQRNTHIPVLGHAAGICHVYIDEFAQHEKARKICIDAKSQYPSACNAAETILVHKNVARDFILSLMKSLLQAGVELRVDDNLYQYRAADVPLKLASEADWSTEYCDLIVSIKLVCSLDDAIEHINRYGSHHTDSIVTEEKNAAEKFLGEVDSAGVYWNASTRFADGFRYGFGAEVGISTGKLHPRGPVGLAGLVTYKYQLVGDGHVVADYVGENAKKFIHRNLP